MCYSYTHSVSNKEVKSIFIPHYIICNKSDWSIVASRPGRGEGISGLGNTVFLAESALLPEKVVIGYFQYTPVNFVSACLRTIVQRKL